MQKLVQGIQQFQSGVFGEKHQLFEKLVEGQHPQALFITCSDSRIDPSLLMQTEPGELFVMRNAGNIVPPYGMGSGGEAATIEYAVCALKVSDIVVCGHSHCGAMAGLLNPSALDKLPAVRLWLECAESTKRIINEDNAHLSDPEERLAAAVEQNVLVQLSQLRTHPTVAAALDRNELNLHGWVYHFETGQVFSYDSDKGQFVAFDTSSSMAPNSKEPSS